MRKRKPVEISRSTLAKGQGPKGPTFAESYDWIGKRLRKKDGREKVVGRAVYGHDLVLPRMLHGKILYSQCPSRQDPLHGHQQG